jgi:tetratricopeptide (TPR) repeat protein
VSEHAPGITDATDPVRATRHIVASDPGRGPLDRLPSPQPGAVPAFAVDCVPITCSPWPLLAELDLVQPRLEHDAEVDLRRTRVRALDGRDVRMAVARLVVAEARGMRTLLQFIALLVLAGCSGTGASDPSRLDRIAAEYERGNIDAAIDELNGYVIEYTRDDLAWTILGNAYEDSDRIDEAQSAYDRALEINPHRFEAITGTGILHRKRGEYEQAMKAYQRALAIDPNYAQAYSSMTVIALKQYEDSMALEYAGRGYELDKTDPTTAANLAVAYHYNGDTENRDRMTRIAEQLGYANVDALRRIYSGELTVRD